MQTKQQTTVEPVENKTQEFISKYNELVQEYGYQLLAVPAYKMRDDNTYSLVIQMQVAELPKTYTRQAD